MAVVSVNGGPDYDVEIAGESNNVSFRISMNNLDFEEVAYNESQPRDFFIEKIGKLPLEFNVNLSSLSRQSVNLQSKLVCSASACATDLN